MKRQYLRMLTAFVVFAGLAISAKAQTNHVDVKIPFEFSAAGKTLPAGTYRVNRVNDRDIFELVLSSVENRTGAILLSTYAERASSDKARFTFESVGGQHFLSKIETGDYAFVIPVSRTAPLVASVKPNGGGVTGSSSGSN